MRAVICDTSPLQYLHQIGLLHLLPTLFGTVQVSLAVAAEMGEGRRRGVPLPELAGLSWVTTRPVDARRLTSLPGQLGSGEKEVLALGLEAAESLLVLDDRDARRHAITMGLEITGTVGILLLAKERGVLDLIQPALDRLEGLRFRLSAKPAGPCSTWLERKHERRRGFSAPSFPILLLCLSEHPQVAPH